MTPKRKYKSLDDAAKNGVIQTRIAGLESEHFARSLDLEIAVNDEQKAQAQSRLDDVETDISKLESMLVEIPSE